MIRRPLLVLAWASLLALPARAEAPATRLLVAIGNNVGDPGDAPLRHAGDDARKVRSLFVELGGVAPERAYLVLDQPAPAVRERLAEVMGRVAELRAAGGDVVLLLYVSAHARAGELHLNGTHLPIADLRQLASRSGARLRMVVVDACDSGIAAQRKGGTAGPEYAVSLDRLPLAGDVLITSSGPAEPSQEWESLGGSLFTHHLLTGLRGDADSGGDGRVSLAEAYGYAYRRTVFDAVRGGQHPAFDLNLAGTGEFVLTEPAAASSAVILPPESEGRYVLASQPRAEVVLELDKRAGRPLRLAVPPGRYVLRKPVGARVGLQSIDLPYGGERTAEEAAFVWRGFAEVAVKGGAIELLPYALLAVGGWESEQLEATGGRLRIGAVLRRTEGPLWGHVMIWGAQREFRARDLTVEESSAAVGVSGGWRFLAGAVVPFVGATVEARAVRQSLERDREAEIRRVFGGDGLPARTIPGFAFGAVAGVEVPLAGRAFALLAVEPLLRFLPAEGQPAWIFGVRGMVGLGTTL